jgi:methionyl-tRNA formyltransferase
MRIVMMGTGTFAEPTFQAILEAFPGEVVGLVTQPDRDVGRRTGASRQTGLGMAIIAKAHSLPVLQPASINSDEGLAQLAALNPDLLVVAAYGQILKSSVLAIPKFGAINVHASLLPKYRGAAPVAHAILNGDTETGVTIIRITPGLDAGEMLAQESLAIGPEETTGELEARLAVLGAKMSVDVVTRMKHGPVNGVKQDSTLVTKAPKITKEMGLINWSMCSSRIADHIRAMQPWPTAYTFLHRPGKEPMRIVIRKGIDSGIEFMPGDLNHDPGFVKASSHKAFGGRTVLIVPGLDDAVLVSELQPAGKNPMPVAEFIRGYPLPEGSRFGPERLA